MDVSGLSSLNTDYLTSTATTSSSKLTSNLKTDYSTASDDELMDACKQFESYFMEQVYKEMEKTVPKSEDSTGSNATLVDYYKDTMILKPIDNQPILLMKHNIFHNYNHCFFLLKLH